MIQLPDFSRAFELILAWLFRTIGMGILEHRVLYIRPEKLSE